MARFFDAPPSLGTLTRLHHAPMAVFTVGILAVSAWVLRFVPQRTAQLVAEAQLDPAAAALVTQQGDQLWWAWLLSLCGFLGFAALSTLVSAWSHGQMRRRLETMVACCERFAAGEGRAGLVPAPGEGALARTEQQLDALFVTLEHKQAALEQKLFQQTLLQQLADGLEMAVTQAERLALIRESLCAVVPGGAVTLLVVEPHGQLRPACGEGCPGAEALRCPALRRGTLLSFPQPDALSACPNVDAPAACQPLVSGDAPVGAIHLQIGEPLRADQEEMVGMIARYAQHHLAVAEAPQPSLAAGGSWR